MGNEGRASSDFSDATGIVTKSGFTAKPARWDHAAQTLRLGDGRSIPYKQCRVRLVRTKYKRPDITAPSDKDLPATQPRKLSGWTKRQAVDDPVHQHQGAERGTKPRAMLSIDDGKWLLVYEGKQAKKLIDALAAASIAVEEPL